MGRTRDTHGVINQRNKSPLCAMELATAFPNGSSFDAPSACSANYTAIDASKSHDFWSVAFGGLMALAAGAGLALSITVQRYALTYPSQSVPLMCWRMSRNGVWAVGLVIYFVANCLFAYSSTLAPLTLAATMYTLLLVWNLAFASLLLKERLTRRITVGACLIIVGATISVLGTPTQAPDTYGVNDITNITLDVTGIVYLALQLGSGLIAAAVVLLFERRARASRRGAEEYDAP